MIERLKGAIRNWLGGLTPARRELRALRAAHERLRAELQEEQERAQATEGELRENVRKLSRARDRVRSERDQLAADLERVRTSRAFRLGHAIILVLGAPVAAVLALASLAARGARALGRAVGRALAAVRRRLARVPPAIGGAVRGARSRVGRLGPTPKQAAPGPEEKGRFLPVPQGNQFLGPLTDGHSTTMFVLWGLSSGELRSTVDEVARLQLMQWDFKPLFVTDSDFWEPFQEHGFWFEHIPPAEEWANHNGGDGWSEFVAERIDSIVASYSPDRIVVYEDADKRGALKHGVLNGVVSGPPVVEATTTAKLTQQPPTGSRSAE